MLRIQNLPTNSVNVRLIVLFSSVPVLMSSASFPPCYASQDSKQIHTPRVFEEQPSDQGQKAKEETLNQGKTLGHWGREYRGLQCRVIAPNEIEQRMPFKTIIEFRSTPKNLEPAVRQLDTFLRDDFLKLSLKNLQTQQVLTVKPYGRDYIGGPFSHDQGRYTSLLDGTSLEPWRVTFPLIRARDALEPGLYECAVVYSFPAKPTRWWDKRKDWKSFGFWSGTVISAPFQVNILKETPKTRKLLLPRKLRCYEKDGKVGYAKQDAIEVDVPVRNGFSIYTLVFNNTTGAHGCSGGVPVPDSINGIGSCASLAENRELSYTITVAESADPFQHLHLHGPTCPGYKLIWEQTFTVSRPESLKDYELTTRYLPPWLPTAKERAKLTGHDSGLCVLAISSDAKTLASGDTRGTFKLWDTATQTELTTFVAHDDMHRPQCRSAVFSPDGKVLASTGFREIALTDVATAQKLAILRDKERGVSPFLAFSPDGTMLAACCNKVILLEPRTLNELPDLEGATEVIGALAFSPDGRFLACGQRTVKLWDIGTKKQIASLQQDRYIYSIEFSPDSKTLAMGTNGGAKIWDVASKSMLASFRGFEARSIAWLPDGKRLAVGEQSGVITLWDIPAAKPLAILPGHQWLVSDLAFFADGKTLASASRLATDIKLWDLSSLLVDTPSREDVSVTKSNTRNQITLAVSVLPKTPANQNVHLSVSLTNEGSELPKLGAQGDPDNCTIQVFDSDKKLCSVTPLGQQMLDTDAIRLSLYTKMPLDHHEHFTWIDLTKYFQLRSGSYTVSVSIELLKPRPFTVLVENVPFDVEPAHPSDAASLPVKRPGMAAVRKSHRPSNSRCQ